MALVTVTIDENPEKGIIRYSVQELDTFQTWIETDFGVIDPNAPRQFKVDLHRQKIEITEEPV